MSVCKVCRNVLLPGVPHQLLTSVTPRNLQVESYRYTNSLLYGSICPLQPPSLPSLPLPLTPDNPATPFSLSSFFTISLSFSLCSPLFPFSSFSFLFLPFPSSLSSLCSYRARILFSLVFHSTFDLLRFDRLRWSPDAKRERKKVGMGMGEKRDDKKVSSRHDLLRIENVT